MQFAINIKRICVLLLLMATLASVMPMQLTEVVHAYDPDPEMADNYMAYTGFEDFLPPPFEHEQNPDWYTVWVGSGSKWKESSLKVRGTYSMGIHFTYPNQERYALANHPVSAGIIDAYATPPRLEYYQSVWMYIPYPYGTNSGWWEWWTMRQNSGFVESDHDEHSGSALAIHLYDGYWWFQKAHQAGTPANPKPPVDFSCRVYENVWSESVTSAIPKESVDPHCIPEDRWFRIEIYVYHSKYDGIFKVWITDPQHPDESQRHCKLLFGIEGTRTSCDPKATGQSHGLLKHYGWSGYVYYDELYCYDYNAHEDIPSPTDEPNKPNAGNPQVNTTIAGHIANISGIASADTLFHNATIPAIYLDTWIVEHNSTGTPQNVTGYFSGSSVAPPAFILCFDDNDPSLTSTVLQIMNSYGFKGVASINCTRSNASLVAQDCASYGWELASHGMTHAHLNSVDNATLYYEILGSKQWLDKTINGSFPVITFAYPYGEGRNNSTVLSVVQKYYELGRHAWTDTVWDGAQNWVIPVYEMTNQTYASNMAEALSEMIGTETQQYYAVLLFHAVEDPEISWGAITPSMFQYVLDEITDSGYPVTTFKQAYLDGQTAMWSFILTLNSSVGTTIELKAWVQDTLGQWSTPSIEYVTTTGSQPSQPPYIHHLTYNTTTITMPVNISCLASDDSALSHWKWGTDNGSASWSNSSWTPFAGAPKSSDFSFAFILNETIGTTIKIEVYVNDSDNQLSSNVIQMVTTDYECPTILSMTHNSTVWQSNILYRVRMQDPYGVEGLFFECNNTGNPPQNSSYQSVTYIGNNTYTWNSSSLGTDFSIINSVYGAKIVYRAYINNTKGKWKVSQNLFFVSGGYHLWFTIKSKYGSIMDNYITWKLYNKTSGVQITYSEGWGTLWGEDYQLRIYYKGDLVRTEDYNMTTQDRSVTINLDALHMTNLAGFIVVNGTTSTLHLLQQDINYIRFNATGAGTFLIKVDSIVSPIIIYKDSVEYGNWTYDSSNDVIDVIGSFSEYEIILPTPYLNPTIAPNAIIIPNMNTMTRFYFTRYLLINNMTIEDEALWIDNNWINATQATSNVIAIHNWFDGFGVSFTPSKSDRMYLNVTGKGAPSKVNGASYNYDGGTSILELNVTANVKCGVHWGSGGTSYLATPDIEGFGHSWGNYKSLYGFGLYLPKQGAPVEQRIFRVTVYANNGMADITLIRLNIGSNIILAFNTTTQTFQVVSNPYDYFHLKEGICASQYNSASQYWQLDFGGTIPEYHPFMQQQNLTVTTVSTIEGSTSDVHYSAFFVYIAEPPAHRRLHIPTEWVIPILGVTGLLMVMISPYYTVRKVKKGDYDTAFMWGIIMFVVGLGLAIVWLWG